MVAMTNALAEKDLEEPGVNGKTSGRKRKRKVEEGRITTMAIAPVGRCISHLAEEMGILPNTMARILIVEGLLSRGWTMEKIKVQFGTAEGDGK